MNDDIINRAWEESGIQEENPRDRALFRAGFIAALKNGLNIGKQAKRNTREGNG